MLDIPALGPDGEYRTRKREVVTDVVGNALAEMTIAPPLYIARTLGAQRKSAPLPVERREAALVRAAEVFATDVIAGLDFDAYVVATSRVSGLPRSVVRDGARSVAEDVARALQAIGPARPTGAAKEWREASAGGAVWTRRGEVFAVHASGNAPGVHGLWPQALALGYRVAVRPSRREPLTGHRLVTALRHSGFGDQDVVYLPTDHAGADELIRSADLAMVYGGQGVVDKYAGDATVWVNGPGRAKILITADHDWREHLDMIVDSICRYGGTACVNATAVLCEGDAAPLAAAIGERLGAVPALPLADHDAVLPVHSVASARSIAGHLAMRAHGATAVLGAEQVVAEMGDGTAVLRPAVHLLATPDPEMLNIELPFPCVWVAPWSRDNGLTPLRGSLVVTVLSGDDAVVDGLLADPSVANVYRGPQPTWHTAPGIPHDGFLADILMRNKGYARA